MYLDHFRLSAAPFSITPDTAFAFSSRAQQEALNTVLLAVDDGEGFIKITGEVGTGKTLLSRRLMAHLALEGHRSRRYKTIYIPNPCLSPRTLLMAVGLEMKLQLRTVASEYELLGALQDGLLTHATRGERVVVCLDETQAMPVETLEALRLLSNLETEKRKLMQVALFGQPELDEKLARHDLRQLRSRISFQYTLSGMTDDETLRYLAHRLRVAGHHGETVFGAPVSKLVHRASRGVPRLVNIMAHKCLLLAFGEGAIRVTPHHVRAAAADTPHAGRVGAWAGLGWRMSRWLSRSQPGANA